MCFGNKAADAARWQANIDKVNAQNDEIARQQRVREAQSGASGSVDAAFAQFNPDYYNRFQTDTINANTPQVEEQYARAMDKATAALAGKEMLKSNLASRVFGDLSKTRNNTLGQIANEAVTAAKQLQQSIEKQKTDLYNMAMSASDPSAVSNRAYGEALSLVQQPKTTMLGDLFGATLAPVVNYAKADTYSPYGGKIASFFGTPPTTGRGSGTVYT